ncbi:MAG: Rv3212 family protein [Pseudonocardiaceae bacterium]
MPVPERRTRLDLIVAVVAAVGVLAVSAALWWASDARHTVAVTAPGLAGQIPPNGQLPAALEQAWQASSPATPVPLVQDGIAVTGGGGVVTGRDLVSGGVRWSYQRNRPLCTVAAASRHPVAVYQRGGTCSEVTALAWADGRRGAQRTGPVEAPTRLAASGNRVVAGGRRYLEVWRSDLIRTLAYGRLPTPVKPGAQPRPDCTHGSMALGPAFEPGAAEPEGAAESGRTGRSRKRLAVIEQCPGERVRLTVQRTDPHEADQPEVDFSTLLGGTQARVVTLSVDRVAVALPDPARLVVLDMQGKAVAEHPLAVPSSDLQGDPPGGLVELTVTPIQVYWFTGSATVALDVVDLRPRWTRPGSLGPGTEAAGRLLVPVPGALAILDPATGQQVGALPVDRGGYRGPVGTASSGGVILEQRGDTLVALR